MKKNWNCNGSHCKEINGEVRLYPLGGGANLILCRRCWAHENLNRIIQGSGAQCPENFPTQSWDDASIYVV